MQTTNLIRKQPLTHRETLTILESLYDLVLQVEQIRRDHSSTEDEQQTVEGQRQYNALVDQIWDALGVMIPLETR
jgi:DNA topoisomerase 2-associated protein PAT1